MSPWPAIGFIFQFQSYLSYLCPLLSRALLPLTLCEHANGCGCTVGKEEQAPSVKLQTCLVLEIFISVWEEAKIYGSSSYWKPMGWAHYVRVHRSHNYRIYLDHYILEIKDHRAREDLMGSFSLACLGQDVGPQCTIKATCFYLLFSSVCTDLENRNSSRR